MAENFCYNQNGINHILEQFGDAISNKQYKNRIPYDIYRKIKNGCQLIFISFVTTLMEENLSLKSLVIAKVKSYLL